MKQNIPNFDPYLDRPQPENMLDMLVFARDSRAILDMVSLSPHARATENGTRVLCTQTYRDGVVRLGDDSSDNSGRTIYPNNGVRLVVPTEQGNGAIVVAVDIQPDKSRLRRVVTQKSLRFSPDGGVTVMEQSATQFGPYQQLEINVERFGYVKCVRGVESGEIVSQELAHEIRQGLFHDPAEAAEFMLVAKALDTCAYKQGAA